MSRVYFGCTTFALLLSLLLGACGDPTATPAVASTTNAFTTTATTTLAPTTNSATTNPPTTVPVTTAAPITAATTTLAAKTTAPSDILEVVRRYDNTGYPLIHNVGVLALDQKGNIFGINQNADEIIKIDASGKLITKWGKKGSADGEFEFIPPRPDVGPSAGFMAVDKSGNVYVSDAYNNRIQKFDNNGKFLSKWGNKVAGATNWLEAPGPITVDNQGNIFVSASGSTVGITKYDPQGKFLNSWNNDGTPGGTFVFGGIGAIDKQGNIYVADLFKGTVRKLDSNAKLITKFGTKGRADGQFFMPVGIALDSKGNMYITDNTERIQKFDANGKYLGQWDSFSGFEVSIVAIDDQDNIYVNDDTIYQLRPKS